MRNGNLLVIQGGGPTPVFNASLTAILREVQETKSFSETFGSRFGMKGLANGDLLPLHLSDSELSALRDSPGAALGSSRFKPSEDDLERCILHLRRHDIRAILFMGGNGTMRGAQLFLERCQAAGLVLQILGVPKTIDNDIAATDRCPGYGSAARFVVQSLLDLSADIRSLRQPVSLFETLGRDVGWLAAASSLARRDPDEAPHLVYLPETPFVLDAFLGNLDNTVSRLGWAVAVFSEGTQFADGTPVFEQSVASPQETANRPLIGGVAQYLSGVVSQRLGLRARSEKPGLIGRSSIAYRSSQDLADAETVGRHAVRALVAGASGFMVSLLPLEASAATRLVSLAEAGGPRRAIPPSWLTGDDLAVSADFRSYAAPLVGPLAHPFSLLSRDGSGSK